MSQDSNKHGPSRAIVIGLVLLLMFSVVGFFATQPGGSIVTKDGQLKPSLRLSDIIDTSRGEETASIDDADFYGESATSAMKKTKKGDKSSSDHGPASPTGAPKIAWEARTAEQSTEGARILNKYYVKKGLLKLVDSACAGTSQDFLDQVARPLTEIPGRASYIDPALWREFQVIIDGQIRRKSDDPSVIVTCLRRAHSSNVAGTGNSSEHPAGKGGDIGSIGGQFISESSQRKHDKIWEAVTDLWSAGIYPCQLISWHGIGGINDLPNPPEYQQTCTATRQGGFGLGAFPMSNHGDHLHVSVPKP